jgi:hypothetical protein
MITANIHGVKSIRMERITYGDFVQHKFVFETEDGKVELSGFAEAALYVETMPTRSARGEAAPAGVAA